MVKYQQGEHEAFGELYSRHSGKVYAYLKARLSQSQMADDLLQTTFLKLHEHRSRYDKRLLFLPWLFTITRNAMIDSIRKKSAILVDGAELERLAGGGGNNQDETREKEVEAAVALLPAEQRELMKMRFKEGLSFEEIGTRLGLNEPTIRKRISRTIQGLRKFFGSKHGER